MEVILIAITTMIVTFALTPLFQKMGKKSSAKLHIHHSVIGLAVLALGLILSNTIAVSIGLGIYLAHGVEEMHYNKRKFPRAFLIFVTRS